MTNRALVPAVRGTTRYHLDPYARILANGTNYRHVKTNDNGHLLSRDGDIEVTEFFTHAEFDELHRNNQLAVSYGWHRSSEVELRLLNDNTLLSDLPVEEQNKIFVRMDLCEAIEAARESKLLRSYSDASLRSFINQAWPGIMKNAADRLGVTIKFGSKKSRIEPAPSPASARKWRKRYKSFGKNPLALRDSVRRCGNRTPRFTEETYAIARTFAERYLDRKMPSMSFVYKEYKAYIDAANKECLSEGRPPFHLLSLRTFEGLIGRLDKYSVCVAREGESVARSRYGAAMAGLYVARAGQRLEMDDATWNVFVWNVPRAEFDRMSPSEREVVEKVRPNVTLGLDFGSECVMGYVVRGCAPSADSSITCLEMCCTDKSTYAEVIGARGPWDMAARVEGVAFDTGPAFIANPVHAAVNDMGATYIHPPTGKPQLRGKIERVIRTLQEGFNSFLTAQTYRNVVEKADYKPADNVCLCIDEFAELLGRWIIDVYHNTPHDSLAGLTPRLAWLQLSERFPIQMPPSAEERRQIFGMRCERAIQKRGVRIMGVHYQSKELQQLRRSVGQLPVDVKIDRYDLAQISVWDERVKEWLIVPAAASDLDLQGVTYWEWVAATRDLQRNNADLSKLSSEIVNTAIQHIRNASDDAIRRAGLHSHIMNLHDLAQVERDHFGSFDYVSNGSPRGDASVEESSSFSLTAPTDQGEPETYEPIAFPNELSGSSANPITIGPGSNPL